TVASDAPLRNVDLNGQDPGVTPGPTTSDCINGVLQYRFWIDTNNNGAFDQGTDTLIRDFGENPTATANPDAPEVIRMTARCSSAPQCQNTTTLAVTMGADVAERPYITPLNKGTGLSVAHCGTPYDLATKN